MAIMEFLLVSTSLTFYQLNFTSLSSYNTRILDVKSVVGFMVYLKKGVALGDSSICKNN